jgi:hypothetical protein
MSIEEKAKGERVKIPPRSDTELHALPDNAFVTEAEAAQLLRLSSTSMTLRRHRCEPPPPVRIGRLIRYRVGEVRHMGETP